LNLSGPSWETETPYIQIFDTSVMSPGATSVIADAYVTPFDPGAFVTFSQVTVLFAATGPDFPVASELPPLTGVKLYYSPGAYPLAVPSAATTAPALARSAERHKVRDRLRLVLTTGVLERPGAVHALHYLGSPVLRQRAAPVAQVDDEVRRLVADLFATMHNNNGVGLAANQIGIPRRVAVVDVGDDDPEPLVLINPRIVQTSEVTETAEEGCLSIPEIYADVERPLAVTVEALDLDGRACQRQVSGFKARAVQHEIDHLDGVLFLDHLSAVKRSLLLAKWKKSRKGKPGYLQEVGRDLTT